MNQKRQDKKKPITYLLLAALGIALGVAGYFAGKSGKEPSTTPNQPQAEEPAQKTSNSTTQTPRKRAITAEAIAKAKNVPARLKNPEGDYTLVTVVEGVDANRRFNHNLKLVGAQRQRLTLLFQRLALVSQQSDQKPAESAQRLELITGQITETRKTLEDSLRFMAQNYSWSLKNKYVLVRHGVSLLSVTEEDGNAKSEVVYKFKNAESYEDFKKKRDVYWRLKLEQAKDAQKTAKKKSPPPATVPVKDGVAKPVAPAASDPVVEQPAQLELTAKIKEKSKEIQKLYKYDPEKNYQINCLKTALYVRVPRLGIPAKAGSSLGKQGGDASKTTESTTQTPQKGAITPEAIAKAKNVPATLKKPQGVYTLVTVVEGADANRRFDKSLRVVGAQRKRLTTLSQQFDKTPADSVQQRELITGQIKETKKKLAGNLRFMAQKYAYSLKNHYIKVTHEASLLSVTKEDGKIRTMKSVYNFKNARDYEDFQKKHGAYIRLKLEQAKTVQAAKKETPPTVVLVKNGTATPVPVSNSVAEQNRKIKPTAEMDLKSKELQQLYKYDPEKTYQINLEKTALYARTALVATPAKAGSNLAKQGGNAAKSSKKKEAAHTQINKKTASITQTPQKRVITPEAIAKASNVPATLNKPQGVYTLVAVVKGADSNRRLNKSLQVVGDQRKRLATLSKQFEKLPADFLQQRELIASQINETRKALEGNLRFMDQQYGYSLKNDYVKVTHEASLLSVIEQDGKVRTAKRVHAFKNAGDYEDFQKKRHVHLRLKLQQAKAAKVAKKKAVPSAALLKKTKELQQIYSYDPDKNYQIRLEKTALYSRAAR